MRAVFSVVALLLVLLNGGCAIFEKEATNRGGYLDAVLDDHWMKADSKAMRALRAFAMQVSLARIASVSAKNDSDRQLLAIRIGALTKRFVPIYMCAFGSNPLAVPGAETDPCFYYDSAMVDYSTGLFDLAMIALPIEDGQKLVSTITGSFVNPVNIVDLLNTLLQIGKDALKYGRVVGALYRDTVELEVQLWLTTPPVDNRPVPYRVTIDDVRPLANIYERGNDNMPAWLAEMAALRGRGLEPIPQAKFYYELGALMSYICGLITSDSATKTSCQASLPDAKLNPAPVLGRSLVSFRIGDPAGMPKGGQQKTAGDLSTPGQQNPSTLKPTPTPTSSPTPTTTLPKDGCPASTTLQDATRVVKLRQQIINGTAKVLANTSATSFGTKTVTDGGNAIVAALTCVNAQLQQASDLTAAQLQKDEYRKLRDGITTRINAIQATVNNVNSSAADKTTVVQAANQINLQLNGAQGLQGAIAMIANALTLLGSSG